MPMDSDISFVSLKDASGEDVIIDVVVEDEEETEAD